MSEVKPFQAESRRLLEMMINSIYTHKEIFLRELISNASDAIDKYYLYALKQQKTPGDLKIRIELDQDNRTLTISDNGIGMDEKELEDNLGTIARSGSLAFKEEMAKNETKDKDVDIIGQFGVGFYSAFMVSDSVSVLSRKAGDDKAWLWTSDGVNGYTIEPAKKEERGTRVTLHLKADDDLESYSQYLESWTIMDLVKRYSDYIRYPIEMDVETEKRIEPEEEGGEPSWETVKETKTLNSMVPLWKRPKSEISQEDFDQFYKEHFQAIANPLDSILFSVEGNVDFTALLYIPSSQPRNFYTRDFKPGLQLYSSGVMIEEHCEELLPDYLRFVQGLVDSRDLSLNISREMLQHDHQLRLIRKRVEKRMLSALESMLKNDREKYETFFKLFGLDLKFGLYNRSCADQSKLEKLLLFSSSLGGLKTLEEIKEAMPEDQKSLYYVSAASADAAAKLPVVASLLDKGFIVLYLNEEIDEFVLQMMGSFDGLSFKNASQGDLDLDTEEEKEALKAKNDENKDLLEFMKGHLPEVSEVRLSNRLSKDAVALVAGDGMSFEMEKVFNIMAEQSGSKDQMPFMQASRILEINPDHPIWTTLRADYSTDKAKAALLTKVLYDQACLIEGFAIKDPIEYSRQIIDLLSEKQ